MIQLTFTPSEVKALHYERFHHPHPRVQRKMEALYLKSQGMPHAQIAQLLCISKPTLVKYLREYEAGGIEQLKQEMFYRPQSQLQDYKEILEAHFRANPPKTLAHAVAQIKELTGVERSREQVRKFLHTLGMRCRRVGVVPAKADPQRQETFKKTN